MTSSVGHCDTIQILLFVKLSAQLFVCFTKRSAYHVIDNWCDNSRSVRTDISHLWFDTICLCPFHLLHNRERPNGHTRSLTMKRSKCLLWIMKLTSILSPTTTPQRKPTKIQFRRNKIAGFDRVQFSNRSRLHYRSSSAQSVERRRMVVMPLVVTVGVSSSSPDYLYMFA